LYKIVTDAERAYKYIILKMIANTPKSTHVYGIMYASISAI